MEDNKDLLQYLERMQKMGEGVGEMLSSMNVKSMGKTPRVTLDPDGCITLTNVLQSFTAGVNEEQAWALCYQIIKSAQCILSDPEDRESVLLVTETEHIKLHQDGSVHKNTFMREDHRGKGS